MPALHERERDYSPGYARHRPEEALLYQLVGRHYSEFVAAREAAGRALPNRERDERAAHEQNEDREARAALQIA